MQLVIFCKNIEENNKAKLSKNIFYDFKMTKNNLNTCVQLSTSNLFKFINFPLLFLKGKNL